MIMCIIFTITIMIVGMIGMRKYIVGFFAGFLFALSFPVVGASISLVGKTVEKEIPVTLDEREIDKAIIVNGRSYLPVRSMADALNLKLEVSKEEINLLSDTNNFVSTELNIKREGLKHLIILRDNLISQYNNTEERMDYVERQITQLTNDLNSVEMNEKNRSDLINEIERLNGEKESIKNRLSELQSQIDEYNQKIQEREEEIRQLETQGTP